MPDALARGRGFHEARAWRDAYDELARADRVAPLSAEDLERLAVAAYLIDRDGEFLAALDRAHHSYLEAREGVHAARCAFWLGLRLLLRGEQGPATGWLARAERLLEREPRDCVERGYLRLPAAERCLASGDGEAAFAAAADAVDIGDRFADADLVACARHLQGRALLQQWRVAEGLTLLDEAMIAVTAGELTPLMTGLVYCSVIDACQRVYAFDRAREWTSALSAWCAAQPQLVAFTTTCRVHRAEVLQWQGAWREAFAEARHAYEQPSDEAGPRAPAAAMYRQGELHRLRGDFAAAEKAYRRASQGGCEPQPGLALLRLAQGRVDAALAALRRLVLTSTDPLERAPLLPAHVEVLLAADEVEEAGAAARELGELAESLGSRVVEAVAAHARGAVALAAGDPRAAIPTLRRALEMCQSVETPYLAARVRELIGLACDALGDQDGRRLELEAARAVFVRLGAAPDVARIDAAMPPSRPRHTHGLTPRELQVLAQVAAGKTNKVIAGELGLSEKTIDRHVSNIFGKLGVSSRAAATSFAYEHRLL
ncbi:MAG TPA: LuxR C-terminal-related transcriptional regulator [Thermoanaerobaculia bacterium]|nr:LuxR C-terminal-related transcriptional regulator [Thermoanaerobaculia bacterium]